MVAENPACLLREFHSPAQEITDGVLLDERYMFSGVPIIGHPAARIKCQEDSGFTVKLVSADSCFLDRESIRAFRHGRRPPGQPVGSPDTLPKQRFGREAHDQRGSGRLPQVAVNWGTSNASARSAQAACAYASARWRRIGNPEGRPRRGSRCSRSPADHHAPVRDAFPDHGAPA